MFSGDLPHEGAFGHSDWNGAQSGRLVPAHDFHGQHDAHLGRAAVRSAREMCQDIPGTPAHLRKGTVIHQICNVP